MAEPTPKPTKTRAKRRNYELELRSLKLYCEMKLEVLERCPHLPTKSKAKSLLSK